MQPARLTIADRQYWQTQPVDNPQIAKWNTRYAEGNRPAAAEPSPLLTAAVNGVRPGRALDLGCGAGRHAVWLAETRLGGRRRRASTPCGRTRRIVSCLIVDCGTSKWNKMPHHGELARHAADDVRNHRGPHRSRRAGGMRSGSPSGLAARSVRRGSQPHVADLEADPPAFVIAEGAYDLIVDCFFLHRPLFAAIRGGVRPGGLLVAALHLPVPGGERAHGYLLEPGELENLVTGWGWTVLHNVEHGPSGGDASDHGLGVAEIVARRRVDA